MADLDVYFPFDAGAGADVLEAGWRSMARNWLTSGPIRLELNSFLVAADSGRNVLLSSGRCWINGHYGELTANATVAIATNTSGNSRIDRIVLRADFVNNKLEYAVLQGTPAGSPAAPALTQNTSIWEISLARLSLADSYSTIPAGSITDERRFAAGRPPGGPFLIAASAVRSTNLSCISGEIKEIPFNTSEDYDTASIHSTSTNSERFTIPGGCGGLWYFTLLVAWEANAVNDRGVFILKNGGLLRTGPLVPATGVAGGESVVAWEYEGEFVPGDYVYFAGKQNSGGTLNIVLARATARYIGSLVA